MTSSAQPEPGEQKADGLLAAKWTAADVGALVAEHQRVIMAGIRRAGVRPAEVDDVAQDVTLQLWKALPRFQEQSHISSFIYTIARNTAIDRLRSEARWSSRAERVSSDRLQHQSLIAPDPADGVADRDLLKHLLKSVSPHQAEILMLRYVEELSVGEIADRLDLSRASVSSRLHRARMAIQRSAERYNGRESS